MKITYETHYKSQREDGRHVATMAAFMARLRDTERELAFPKGADMATFTAWKARLQEKVEELLCLPAFTAQPLPQKLREVQREGYRVEKWEFYPDDYSAVPFLALIPDGADKDNKVSAVMCLPGSIHSKEFIAGEPLLDCPKCRFEKFPERNKMALYMVQNGMAAFAFDNPATAECALDIDREDDFGGNARAQMCYGLLQNGENYFGYGLFQKLCFLNALHVFDFVDTDRLAVSAHSLGCDEAMYLGLLRDEIKAIVFNDFVCDERHRYYATTEYDEDAMRNHVGDWHIIPGEYKYYARQDVLAALAPKFLALNEGGPEIHLDMIREAYRLFDSADRLQISHYPKYQDENARCQTYDPPQYGLSERDFLDYSNCDAYDHSFRQAPAVALLKKAFFK